MVENNENVNVIAEETIEIKEDAVAEEVKADPAPVKIKEEKKEEKVASTIKKRKRSTVKKIFS